jgi:HrpA-like RNA helicase
VLLRRLQNADFLSCVSHIVVDEVHERQVETDFLMTILKQRAADYPHLRLVMMSATMQEGLFASYFSCPIVYVAGRMFPVEEHYLSDVNKLVAAAQHVVATDRRGQGYDAASYDPMAASFSRGRRSGASGKGSGKSGLARQMEAAEINAIRPPRFDAETVAEVVIRIIETHSRRNRASFLGDTTAKLVESNRENAKNSNDLAKTGDCILVFLSGMQAIDRVNRALRQRNMSSLNAQVLLLHGSLPPEQQRRVFRRTQPGEWKVVLSTNIAETSVTVDDVTHVVDCGLVKEMRFDPVANTSSLEEVVISKASARQRAGRAGRVRVCPYVAE